MVFTKSPHTGSAPKWAVALLSATRKNTGFIVPSKATKSTRNNTNHVAVFQRVQEAGKGGLFLGQLDFGLVGNTESAHVNCSKGKAKLVPNVGRHCNITRKLNGRQLATSMFC